jgi:hypothetical protein
MWNLFLLSLKLPPGLIIQLDRIIRQCLWRDRDGPKQSLAAWDLVCKPKDKGGLGIVNFSKKNDALLLKQLDKFYNKSGVPWVQLIWYSYYTSAVPHAERLCGSFWWQDIMKLVEGFRDVSKIMPGKGDTILFWSDNWHILDSNQPLCERFPRLFSYVLDTNMSVAEVYTTHDRSELYYRPMSAQAYEEYCSLQEALGNNPLTVEKMMFGHISGETLIKQLISMITCTLTWLPLPFIDGFGNRHA